jgi:hypothetical protein
MSELRLAIAAVAVPVALIGNISTVDARMRHRIFRMPPPDVIIMEPQRLPVIIQPWMPGPWVRNRGFAAPAAPPAPTVPGQQPAVRGQAATELELGEREVRVNRRARLAPSPKLETLLELQRELHRTWPAIDVADSPGPPGHNPRLAMALSARRELEHELQRELHRMPPMPAVPGDLVCGERLAKIAHYAPVLSRIGPGECGAVDLVRLDQIVMPDQSQVALNPAPTLRCGMAEELARFVHDDLGPAAAELGSPLASITDLDSYSCRTRDNIKGAKVSEHGKGNAIDINIVRLRNGGVFNLTDRLVSKAFRNRLRVAACARFMTVLGPGSDSYHAEHIHLDLAERSHSNRICQWDVLEPVAAGSVPLPNHPHAKSRGFDAKAQALHARKTKTAPGKAGAVRIRKKEGSVDLGEAAERHPRVVR